jgi:tRNA nucleotidyltransferase (CCA-adding enzyme)
VKVIIKEQFVLKRIEKREVLPLNLEEKYDAAVEDVTISVLLKVPKRLERELSAESISIFVDCEEIDEEGAFTLPLGFESMEEDVTFLKTEPNSVTIEVKEKTETPR